MANYTILLVDYEPRSIERTRAPLVAAGYTVHVAGDGLAAIAAFEQLRPNLMLIEAMIPKKHGFEVCQEIKRTPDGKRTPIIITTGVYKGRKYRSQALHIYHCDEYVEKPVSDEQLLGVVRRFLGEPPASVAEDESLIEPLVDASLVDVAEDVQDAVIEVVDAEADQAPAPRPMPGSTHSDPAEREILERLDSILPGGGGGGGRAALAAALEPVAAQSQPAPTAEELISGEIEIVDAVGVEVGETAPAPGPSQVISLDDARRARKAKKKPKNARAASVAAPKPVPPPAAAPAVDASGSPAAKTQPKIAEPGTPATPSLTFEQAVPKSGLPFWVLGLATLGVVIAIYFLAFAK